MPAAKHQRLHIIGAALISSGPALIAIFNPFPDGYAIIGLMFGTMFGQTTLAAAWTCFGYSRLPWRIGVSLLWIMLLVLGLAINVASHGGGPGLEIIVVMSLCLLGQWSIVQLPLWFLVGRYRLRLDVKGEQTIEHRPQQFGLRQLMIFTTVVAVLLGIGRVAVPEIVKRFHFSGEVPIFIFLAIAAILMTLPLLLAGFLPKLPGVAVAVILLMIAAATMFELPLLSAIHRGPGPEAGHFVWINIFTAAWVVAGVMAVRLSGYELRAQARFSNAKV